MSWSALRKGHIDVRHVHAALQIHDRDFHSVARFHGDQAIAGQLLG